jgi:RNA polymerase sigma-54 factor
MQMGQNLRLEQTQKLIMTPELRQAITILQLSVPELEEYVEEQLLENPVLDMKEEEAVAEPPKTEILEKREIDWQEYFRDGTDWGESFAPRERDEKLNYENYVTQLPTLQDHLMFQLHLALFHPQELSIGEHLIGNIDGHGYLCCPVEEISAQMREAPALVQAVLKIIQSFDPPGVGARSLAECLLLQMESLGVDDPLARKVIQYHLEELGKGTLQKMAKMLGCTPLEVQRVADFIKTLDPKPGRNFGGDQEVRYITPDVVVEKVENKYIVLVNDTSVPRLSVNAHYHSLMRSGTLDGDTKNFLEGKLHDAVWLIKSIEQRRQTLLKVVESIVNLQRDFFDAGTRYLKPLTLRQIAERIGMHESTVSRATNNKYVQTPRGLFPLRFFFSSGVEQTDGDGASAESIKQQIKELLQKEESDKPLSDQMIAEIFIKQGIQISRRTVAKYRDEIGIPPSSKRKRF